MHWHTDLLFCLTKTESMPISLPNKRVQRNRRTHCDWHQHLGIITNKKRPPRLVWWAQSSKVWNSLASCSLCAYPEKCMQLRSPVWRIVANKHGSRKLKNNFCFPGVIRNIPKMFLAVPRVIVDLFWKSRKLLFRFSEMLLIDTDSEIVSKG